MAKTKTPSTEREYVIPLRREILKVPRHKRTPKAIKAIKQFLAKHMRIPDRDVSKIKLDDYLNKEIWHKGIKNPPTKIKVKVKREGELIRVTLVDLPDRFKFEQARKDKKALEATKKKSEKSKPKTEEKKEELTEEKKKEESEKKESSTEAKQAQAKEQKQTQKHTQSAKEKKVQPQRKALQK